jgi:hypothetical protein
MACGWLTPRWRGWIYNSITPIVYNHGGIRYRVPDVTQEIYTLFKATKVIIDG